MAVKDKFVEMGIKKVELETFLEKTLGRAGYAGVDIRRLPTGTRVALYVERPGMVIGKKGGKIHQLEEELEKRFKIERPQIEVLEIKNPELCAPIMAKRIAFAIERGINVRRVGQMMLRRIMEAGAKGAEIVIAGKIAGERKKRVRFYQGYLVKTGDLAQKYVSYGYAQALTKPGTIGVKVWILPPDAPILDKIWIEGPKVVEEVDVSESEGNKSDERGGNEGET
ncbi:MAG: 30S ribosomal protein S3 [Candidatus Hadarchaeales archaeon]